MKRLAVALLLCLLVIASVLAVVAALRLDPASRYIGPDGHLHLTGSFDGQQFAYLTAQPRDLVVLPLHAIGDRGRTMSWPAPFHVQDAVDRPTSFSLAPLAAAWTAAAGALQAGVRFVFSFFVQDARAVNTCTWSNVGGTGLWSTATNWNTCGGLIPQALDAVVFDATSVANASVNVSTNYLRNFTIAAAYTGTVTANADINIDTSSTVTINGALVLASGKLFHWYVNPGSATLTGTGTITGAGIVRFVIVGTGTFNPSAFTYVNVDFITEGTGPYTVTLGGGVTATGALGVIAFSGVSDLTVNTNGKAIVAATLNITATGTRISVLQAGSSSVSFSGNASISTVNSYIISTPSGSWTVGGVWFNASTSASWSFAAPITFTSAAGGTMVFAGSNLSGAEFANVTFTSSAGTAQTFTMATRGLVVGTALTISDASSTTTLDTSVSNLAITTAALTVSTGGILNARASTITISGNLSVVGTYSSASATTVLSGNGQTIAANGANLGLLQITASGTKTFSQSFTSGLLTVNVDGVTMAFAGGTTWTYSGTNLTGPQRGILTMQSSDGGFWNLSITNGIMAYRIAVSMCNASNFVNATDTSNVNNGQNGNWIFAPPSDVGILKIVVSCAYASISISWTCRDWTNYSGFDTTGAVVNWVYDGRAVATSWTGAQVSFHPPGATWADAHSLHTLIVQVVLGNGGVNAKSFTLTVDNSPAWGVLIAIFVVFLFIVALAVRNRRKGPPPPKRFA